MFESAEVGSSVSKAEFEEKVPALRVDLLKEHLGRDTSDLDDAAALRVYRQVAFANVDRRAAWQPLEGMAYAVDPHDYGL